MACGTPTVVTTHGGLFRVLRFGIDGLFADAFDPKDLGITIVKALRHPKLASACHATARRRRAACSPGAGWRISSSLRWKDVDLVREGYRQAIEVLHRNITPLGFSAAALTDSNTTGTDANYRSVWARDGAVTVLQSLFIDDQAIREAQRTTLTTLLDHMSARGQIPSSVHLDTGQPDCSGVGGIASIDSGLWVVIAFYNYIQVTGDQALLEKYATRLRSAMAWLAAHDSNNDSLLEVPEAGDWTDLFGHSYNILYDETLWCRANVCYGRLLERLVYSRRSRLSAFRGVATFGATCSHSYSTSST